MENIQVVCIISVGFTLGLYTEHRPDSVLYIYPYLLQLFCLSSAVSLAFSMLAVWFSVQCQLAAQSDNFYLLLTHTRLPIPSSALLASVQAKADNFEVGEKNKVYRRVPFVESPDVDTAMSKPPLLARSLRALAGILPGDIMHANVRSSSFSHLPQFVSTGTESKLNHIRAFKALQGYWVNCDIYASICMSLGQFAFLHSVIFYIMISVMQYEAQVTGIGCTLLLMVMASIVIYLDLIKRDARTHITCALFCFGPMFALIVSISDFYTPDTPFVDQVSLQILSVCAFLSEAAWYAWLWFLCMPTSSGLPERYRSAVMFLNLFDNAGLKRGAGKHDASHEEKSKESLSTAGCHDAALARVQYALKSPIYQRRHIEPTRDSSGSNRSPDRRNPDRNTHIEVKAAHKEECKVNGLGRSPLGTGSRGSPSVTTRESHAPGGPVPTLTPKIIITSASGSTQLPTAVETPVPEIPASSRRIAEDTGVSPWEVREHRRGIDAPASERIFERATTWFSSALSDDGDPFVCTFRYWILRLRYGISNEVSDEGVKTEAIRINGTFLLWKLLRVILGIVILLCMLLACLAAWKIGGDPPLHQVNLGGRHLLQEQKAILHSGMFPWPYVPNELRCKNGSLWHSNGYIAYRGRVETGRFAVVPDRAQHLIVSDSAAFVLHDGDVVSYERSQGNRWQPTAKVALSRRALYADVIAPSTLIIVTGNAVVRVRNNTASVIRRNGGNTWVLACRDHRRVYLVGREPTGNWEISRVWL